jgi:hypothetical protein
MGSIRTKQEQFGKQKNDAEGKNFSPIVFKWFFALHRSFTRSATALRPAAQIYIAVSSTLYYLVRSRTIRFDHAQRPVDP